MHLKTAALDTPRVARQHCMISHHFGTYPDSSVHLPVEVVANYCSVLHTLPIQASTLFIYYTSITLSRLYHVVRETKEQGGGKWFGRRNETLTFSGGCRSSLVGVSGLLPSLVLRFFLVPAVAPGLFFCWYSFSCEKSIIWSPNRICLLWA